MEVEVKIIKGGVREYRTKSIIQRLRNIIMSNKVAGSPKNLFIEKSLVILLPIVITLGSM